MWTAGVEGGPTPAPRSVDLAGSAIRLALSHYWALLGAVAVVLVPCFVVGGAALGYWRSTTAVAGHGSALTTAAELVGLLVVVVGGFLAQAVGVQTVTSAAVGAKTDWRASVRAAFSSRSAALGAALAISVIAGVGLVIIIPGIILWLSWYVAMPVVVIEGADVRTALRRSASLVTGRRLTILGAFLLVELPILACALPAGSIAGAIFAHSAGAKLAAEQVAAYGAEVLLTPLQVALVLVVYLDLRTRLDGVLPRDVARSAGIAVPDESRAEADSHARTAERYGPDRDPGERAGATPPIEDSGNDETAAPEVQPEHGPGSPGWPGVSPKPSAERPTFHPPASTWPGVSPKPAPPQRRSAPRDRVGDAVTESGPAEPDSGPIAAEPPPDEPRS